MMTYYIPALLLSLLALLPLIRVARHRAAPQRPTQNDEQRVLIAAWRIQSVQHPEQQAENDYRLYHELKNLRAGKNSDNRRLPIWTYGLILLAFTAAAIAWQYSDNNYRYWYNLQQQLAPALLRSQYLGELDNVPQESLTIYCQALQQRIDRRDVQQLDNLGRCYSRGNQYAAAAEIYARAYRIAPENQEIALNYAQTTLFATPDRPMPEDIETILRSQSTDNPLAKILLAAGYIQSNKPALAAPLWEELRTTLPKDHPFYRLIPPKDDANSTTAITHITVRIAAETLANLPPNARLYITASLPDSRMPIAVRALSPAAEQTIQLTDRDTMTGESLDKQAQLTYRAILSADGNVSGARIAEKETTTNSNENITFQLP